MRNLSSCHTRIYLSLSVILGQCLYLSVMLGLDPSIQKNNEFNTNLIRYPENNDFFSDWIFVSGHEYDKADTMPLDSRVGARG